MRLLILMVGGRLLPPFLFTMAVKSVRNGGSKQPPYGVRVF